MSDSTRPVTGFHARTDAEKLQKIAALCKHLDSGATDIRVAAGMDLVIREVRAVLAEPGPAVQHEFVGWSGNPAFCSICGVPHSRHAEPGPAVPAHTIDREGAWQDWKAREARYRDSSMTDLRQAFEAGWDAAAAVRPSAPVSDTRTGGVA